MEDHDQSEPSTDEPDLELVRDYRAKCFENREAQFATFDKAVIGVSLAGMAGIGAGTFQAARAGLDLALIWPALGFTAFTLAIALVLTTCVAAGRSDDILIQRADEVIGGERSFDDETFSLPAWATWAETLTPAAGVLLVAGLASFAATVLSVIPR
ncbi:MAG: hypothetical protein AAFU73_20135 [Planctomycetota bacterium]